MINFISQNLGHRDIHQALGIFFWGQIAQSIFNSVFPCAKYNGDHYSTYLGDLVKLTWRKWRSKIFVAKELQRCKLLWFNVLSNAAWSGDWSFWKYFNGNVPFDSFFPRNLLSVKCYDLELKHNTSNGVSDLSTTPLNSTNKISRQAN